MLNSVLRLLHFRNSDYCFKPASWFHSKDLARESPYPLCASTGPKQTVKKFESYEIQIISSNILLGLKLYSNVLNRIFVSFALLTTSLNHILVRHLFTVC